MYVVTVYDKQMNPINTHYQATKPTFTELTNYRYRYDDGAFTEYRERYTDKELSSKSDAERQAEEEKQAELNKLNGGIQ